MPKTKRTTMKLHVSLPRRISESEARARYRKEKLGLPGPVDRWIAASTTNDQGVDSGCPLGPDEVQCLVQMQHIEVSRTDTDPHAAPSDQPQTPDDNPVFSDPDTFVLHLTVTGAALARASHSADASSRRVVLDRYVGWSDSLEAPDWTKWEPGQTTAFLTRKSIIAGVARKALWGDAVRVAVSRVGSCASVWTYPELTPLGNSLSSTLWTRYSYAISSITSVYACDEHLGRDREQHRVLNAVA